MPFDPVKVDFTAENLMLLCTTIENSDNFYMGDFSHNCNTPACIAGHAVYLWPDIRNNCTHDPFIPNFTKFARKIGVPEQKIDDLCMHWSVRDSMGHMRSCGFGIEITPKMASAALRRLKRTGRAYFDVKDA